MPTKARWFIKTAFLYLGAGLTLALVRAAQSADLLPGEGASLWLPQLHFLTVGWLTQLIFGVAYWLFPNPASSSDTGQGPVLWMAYGALNVGLLLRLGAEPAFFPAAVQAWGLVASAFLQWVASLLLVGHFWWRVRAK